LKKAKTVLISPLDWGLGHATRIIPIIREFQAQGANIILGAEGKAFNLLKIEFPDLLIIRLPGISMHYPNGKFLALKLGLEIPAYLKQIRAEHQLLEKIIDEYSVDIVLSDNRYGLWSGKCKAIFMTHQLQIQAPGIWKFMNPIIQIVNYSFIRKFDECWIPDIAQFPGISGKLGHPAVFPKSSYYIGILSRFKRQEFRSTSIQYDYLGIVSGPEPQRTQFQNLLFEAFSKSKKRCALICGLLNDKLPENQTNGNVHLFDHLRAEEFLELIHSSDTVICRSGYSGIMDMIVLQKKAILIPTPGQTEQEYLAKILNECEVFYSVSENEFKLSDDIFLQNQFSAPDFIFQDDLLKKNVARVLQIEN
jgi:UDP:flavonoid glycosyltransferase YjiC (YdhE family)